MLSSHSDRNEEAKLYLLEGDRCASAHKRKAAMQAYLKAYKLYQTESPCTDEDYRHLIYCISQIARCKFASGDRFSSSPEKSLKLILGFSQKLTHPWQENDYRMQAECYALLAKCYPEGDPIRRDRLYAAFSILRDLPVKSWKEKDCRHLIRYFNAYHNEFPTLQNEMSIHDYRAVMKAVAKINCPTSKDYLAFALACKKVGVAYLQREDKKAALEVFFDGIYYLNKVIQSTNPTERKSTLRSIELYFRSLKCHFSPGTLEERLFSCAELMFSSPLKISETERLQVYTYVLRPLMDTFYHHQDDVMHKSCYKHFVQFLDMLRDNCKSGLFPEGAFLSHIQKEDIFNSFCETIEKLRGSLHVFQYHTLRQWQGGLFVDNNASAYLAIPPLSATPGPKL